MTKLHIQIREETKRELTIEETFAYILSKDMHTGTMRRKQADEYLNTRGIFSSMIGEDLQHSENAPPVYICSITTTRNATPAEIIAYHFLQIFNVCKTNPNGSGECDCPFNLCCIMDESYKNFAKDMLKDKEVVISAAGKDHV
jgi:hypothetical protein